MYDIAGGLPQVLYSGTNYYIYGPAGVPVEQVIGSTVTYLHHDQLGSMRILTDASRNVTATYSYDSSVQWDWVEFGSSVRITKSF